MTPTIDVNRKMIPLEIARWRLGMIWFSGSAVVSLILVVQSLTGQFEDRSQAVWGWALPNFVPTLSLMIGVFAASALVEEAESDRINVRRPFFILSCCLSVFHLVLVSAPLLIQPLIPALTGTSGPTAQMAAFTTSSLWLAPMQGLVTAVMGVLFFTRTKTPSRPRAAKKVAE